MPYSYASYIGNGVTKAFAIPFGYLLPRDIYVSVNDVVKNQTSDYLLDTSYVTFSSAPAAGSVVMIVRHTDVTAPMVTWESGSIITESDLNLAFLQQFYLIQELIDGLAVVGNSPEIVVPVSDTAKLIQRMFLFLSNHTTVTYP